MAIVFARVALLVVLAGPIAGCDMYVRKSASEIQSNALVHIKEDHLGAEDLEQANRAFADRYVMRISTACDLIIEENHNEAQCRSARDLRAGAAMSMYDIVTDPDPYMQTLNLTVVVTLQAIAWADEDKSHLVFGDHGGTLVDTMKAAHKDVLEVAAKVFSPSEIETIESLIRDWRSKNPELRHLSHARFSDFMNSSEWEAATREKASGLFAQIEQTRQTVDEARALAERTLYLGKRMPLLLEWQSETTLDTLAANPPVARALNDFHTVADVANRMPETLDAQRKAIVADFDQHQPALDATVKNIGATLGQADTLAQDAKVLLIEMQKTSSSLQDLIKQSDAIAGRYMPARAVAPETVGAANQGRVPRAAAAAGTGAATAPSAATATTAPAPTHPFDIRDYTAALKEAGETTKELNAALLNSEKLLDSPSWQARIEEINSAADGRMHLAAEQSQILVGTIFRQVYIALGGLLVVLVAARLSSAWMLKRMRLKSQKF
jgi:hypothetical protein